MVTIGIVTYNRAHLLPRAISAVLSQTYADFELIISDDNSKDDTATVVQPFLADKRIKYIRHHGVGMTGNFLEVLKIANRKYFMWLCDDDYIENNYLEKTLQFLEQHPDYSLACGVTRFFSKDGIQGRYEYMDLENDDPVQRVCTYFKEVNSNIILYGLMRREQVMQFIYPNTFGADLLWSSQVAFSGKVKIIKDTFFYYSIEGISQQTENLKNYYTTTQNKVKNPYLVLRKEVYRLISHGSPVFKQLGSTARFLLASRVWLIIRERFCMPAAEARIRGALALRTRLKKIFR